MGARWRDRCVCVKEGEIGVCVREGGVLAHTFVSVSDYAFVYSSVYASR